MEATLFLREGVAVRAVARHAIPRAVEVQQGGDDVGAGGGQGGGKGGAGVRLEKRTGVGNQKRTAAAPRFPIGGGGGGGGGGGVPRVGESRARSGGPPHAVQVRGGYRRG